MRKSDRSGFTIVELIVTITVTVMILTLAVVSLENNQKYARDEKRKSDVSVIAQQLEDYYGDATYGVLRYPPTVSMNTEAKIKITLFNLDQKAYRAPGVAASSATSIQVAASASSTQTPTTSQYIYQPLGSDNSLCTVTDEECRKFILYYRSEADDTVQTVTSRHQ